MNVHATGDDDRIPCTVGILTRDNEDSIEAAIESVKEFAQVVVSDGGSRDRTVEIAQRMGAQVLHQHDHLINEQGRLIDFAGAMNQLIDAADEPWFYKLDSDEYLSEELVSEIRNTLENEPVEFDAFRVTFKYVLHGTTIEHATTYPSSGLRLFRVAPEIRFERAVHETVEVEPDRLGVLEHPHLKPQPLARELASKWFRYLCIEFRLARGIGLARWRSEKYRWHRWAGARMSRAYINILRERRVPSLPARYELLRILNEPVAIVATFVAALLPGKPQDVDQLRPRGT